MNPRTVGFRRRLGNASTILRVATAIVGVVVLAYIALSAYIADRFSRPKRVALTQTPSAFGLDYEEVSFPSAVDGLKLSGWWIKSSGTRVIIILHGRENARVDASGKTLEMAAALVRHGYDVLMFDFRGHGESEGSIYSLGQLEVRDLAGALDFLKKRGIATAGALGLSMGAATALLAAPDHHELRAVVADAAYADLSQMLHRHFSIATGLPNFLIPGVGLMARLLYGIDILDVKPERSMARLVDLPVLLVHGAADDYIPIDHAYALQRAGASNPGLETWIVPGSGHVQSFVDHPDEYIVRVVSFFDRHLK